MFDIDGYYPSISPGLLYKALGLARRTTNISGLEMDIIRLARRHILEFGGKLWSRKDRDCNFDIMMGSIDSAQVTDLVGLYILQEIKGKIPALGGGLYRDNALFITRGTERILKKYKKHYMDYSMNWILKLPLILILK